MMAQYRERNIKIIIYQGLAFGPIFDPQKYVRFINNLPREKYKTI